MPPPFQPWALSMPTKERQKKAKVCQDDQQHYKKLAKMNLTLPFPWAVLMEGLSFVHGWFYCRGRGVSPMLILIGQLANWSKFINLYQFLHYFSIFNGQE